MAKVVWDPPEIEYVDGLEYPKVSPKRIHSMVQFALGTVLKRCAAGRGAVGPEWRFRLAPGTELVPDVAYVSYERLRPLEPANLEEPPFAPDIAGEVRSPSHHVALSQRKVQKYLASGSVLVLDVDPVERVVYAHSADGNTAIHRTGDRFSSGVIEWLQFDVDELFADIDIPR